MNTTCGFIEHDYEPKATIKEPTRVCSVCGTHELEYSGLCYSKPEFWLCLECLKKLKKLLDKSTES